MGKEYFYLYKAIFFGFAALILIPKEQYRKYILYGIFLGMIPQLLIVIVFSGLLHWYRYENMGVFNIAGLVPFWSPISWMFAVSYFLYLLPRKRIVLYLYVGLFSVYGPMVGTVLENYGLFKYVGLFRYVSPLMYLLWFGLAAWIYIRAEKIELIR